MQQSAKIYRAVFILLMTIMGALAIYAVTKEQWADLFVIIQAIAISSVPYFIERQLSIHTPYALRTSFILFMFATLILGEIADLYNTFWWWDIVLHTVSSAGITVIGFILVSIIFRDKDLKTSALITSFLVFSFAMCFAVLWEVYEFLIDLSFDIDTPMQPSNVDTMTDLIVAMLGSLVICFYGYHYLKRQTTKTIVAEMIEEGKMENL